LNTIVEAFNNYFNRIADSIHNQIKENGTNRNNISSTDYSGNYMTYMSNAFGGPFPNIQIRKTMSFEIETVIESLKISHTHEYDETSNNILKDCKTFISAPLSYLCNRVLFEGIFSDRLKYATIVPVYKRGDRNTISNYRPISILTTFNKIFEKIMYSRMIKHLNITSYVTINLDLERIWGLIMLFLD
jgi:Notch-like protein